MVTHEGCVQCTKPLGTTTLLLPSAVKRSSYITRSRIGQLADLRCCTGPSDRDLILLPSVAGMCLVGRLEAQWRLAVGGLAEVQVRESLPSVQSRFSPAHKRPYLLERWADAEFRVHHQKKSALHCLSMRQLSLIAALSALFQMRLCKYRPGDTETNC